LKKSELRPFPGQEPNGIKSDIPVFDRCNATRRVKLFDEELPSTVEERQPYTLGRRKRPPRPFLSPAGEVVMRLRGGRGFTPIYAPWSPAGLARVRGTVVRVANGWALYPRLWAAREPGLGPYVLRAVAELAMSGADISGCNHPLAADYAEHVLRTNGEAQVDLNRIGPRLDDGEPLPDPEIKPEFCVERGKGWKPAMARVMHDLELEANKLKGKPLDAGRRVDTSERRNEAGEYGPETKLTPDGRVVFGKNGLPVYRGSFAATRGGAWRDRGRPPRRARPDIDGHVAVGRKPVHGFALSARLRKAKQRCKERGLPFVIERYVKEKEPA
jgi:hypothetical protein